MLPTVCRVFIFEDEFFDKEAIKSILQRINEIQIVGAADKIGEALEICRQKNPNLIIADGAIYDDKTIGPSFVKSVRKVLPEVRILGLTRYPDMVDLLKRAGCDFVVNKRVIENHEDAVSYIRETLLPRVQYVIPLKPPSLTQDEDEVLRMIADGNSEDQIAVALGFPTRKPVRRIKKNLFNKFGASTQAQLVNLAFKTGYLKPDD